MHTLAVVVASVVVVASIELSLPFTLPPPWIEPPLIDRLEEYLSTNRVLIDENQHFNVV
jgi:hypothetical protein